MPCSLNRTITRLAAAQFATSNPNSSESEPCAIRPARLTAGALALIDMKETLVSNPCVLNRCLTVLKGASRLEAIATRNKKLLVAKTGALRAHSEQS